MSHLPADFVYGRDVEEKGEDFSASKGRQRRSHDTCVQAFLILDDWRSARRHIVSVAWTFV
jgi:hypothetical protein